MALRLVRRVDEQRAGVGVVLRPEAVRGVLDHVDDRQVAHQILLRVHAEAHLAGDHEVQHFGADVEGVELDLAEQLLVAEIGDQRVGRAGAERKHRLHVGMRRQIGLGAARDVGRIGRDGDDFGAAARRLQPVVEAVAAFVEADVADLVVDADDLEDALAWPGSAPAFLPESYSETVPT